MIDLHGGLDKEESQQHVGEGGLESDLSGSLYSCPETRLWFGQLTTSLPVTLWRVRLSRCVVYVPPGAMGAFVEPRNSPNHASSRTILDS